MGKAGGVAHHALFPGEVLQGAVLQIAVAGVHGDHAVFDAVKNLQGILSRQDGVGGVVIDSKIGVFPNRIHEVAEYFHGCANSGNSQKPSL